MSRADGAQACRAFGGTFHGMPTVGFRGREAWFEALADAGPRVVRLGLANDPNILAETPDVAWATPRGPYRLFGGHRLWLAPEAAARNADPDGDGLAFETLTDGVRLTGRPSVDSRCIRSIEIHVDLGRPVLHVAHEIWNDGDQALELAPWAITQLPPGGMALLPQPTAAPGHATSPNRAVALWPYASWEDPRLSVRDGLIAVRGDPGPDLKVGSGAHEGWVAWAGRGRALVRRWASPPGATYPDLGSSAEVFVGADYTELEVLGPMTLLRPGERAVLDETWELRSVASDDPGVLRETLARPISASPTLSQPDVTRCGPLVLNEPRTA